MKYVICGKSDSYTKYCAKNKGQLNQIINARTKKVFDLIEEDDTVVLLSGWWTRSWSEKALKEVRKLYPSLDFEYHDGQFGEKKRNSLKSESISSRFDLLDL